MFTVTTVLTDHLEDRQVARGDASETHSLVESSLEWFGLQWFGSFFRSFRGCNAFVSSAQPNQSTETQIRGAGVDGADSTGFGGLRR